MAGNFADTSGIVDATAPAAADIKDPIDALDDELYNLEQGDSAFTQLNLGVATTVTIATGAVTVSGSFHEITNEASAGTDTLDTINGGAEGDIVVFRPTTIANTTSFSNGVGNIYTSTGATVALTGHKTIAFICVDESGLQWWQI